MSKKKIIIQEKSGSKKSTDSQKQISANAFAFGKENYIIILAGIAILVIGYLLMIGGGADKPEDFNPEIFSTRRVTVAPVTLLIGFGVVLYGIMKRPKDESN